LFASGTNERKKEILYLSKLSAGDEQRGKNEGTKKTNYYFIVFL
jgi:hypothetical protein